MTKGERVKDVRKTLGLTLEKFGEKLGVKKNAISQIETGRNALTDQMAKSICREYNVRQSWLDSGEGTMFVDDNESYYRKIDEIMTGESDIRKNIFKALIDADEKDIMALEHIIDRFLQLRGIPSAEPIVESPEMTIDEKIADYRRQLELEAKSQGKSSVLLDDA
jgi:transcriptional regulator with XRE-family HTH domain